MWLKKYLDQPENVKVAAPLNAILFWLFGHLKYFQTEKKKSIFHMKTRQGGEAKRYPYDQICCQLTLDHFADIYSFLETSVGP